VPVIHVGDYDPSGLYMGIVDIGNRLRKYGAEPEIINAALTDEDGPALGLGLSFPVTDKADDPRYDWWCGKNIPDGFTKRGRPIFKWGGRHYGPHCWELDAMNSNDLRDRLEEIVQGFILDKAAWKRWEVTCEAQQESTRLWVMQMPLAAEMEQKAKEVERKAREKAAKLPEEWASDSPGLVAYWKILTTEEAIDLLESGKRGFEFAKEAGLEITEREALVNVILADAPEQDFERANVTKPWEELTTDRVIRRLAALRRKTRMATAVAAQAAAKVEVGPTAPCHLEEGRCWCGESISHLDKK